MGMPALPARPLLKWPGGKSSELDGIRAAMPSAFARYIEPFVGGGAVWMSIDSSLPALVNDASVDLVSLYRLMAQSDPVLLGCVAAMDVSWTQIGALPPSAHDIGDCCQALAPYLGDGFSDKVHACVARARRRKLSDIARMRGRGEEPRTDDLMSTALKGGLYTTIRAAYNQAEHGGVRAALFWFLREFCYGGMFRVNARGGFNVPYGGISYDGRGMAHRLRQLALPPVSKRLSTTGFWNADFADFFRSVSPAPDDFVFLDPPYDSKFSTYDGMSFARSDHLRLARCLADMQAMWMLVIAETDFVRETYGTIPGVHVSGTELAYKAGIKNRYERGATHLTVTNYRVG